MKVRELIGFDQYMAKVRAASDTVRAAFADPVLTDHLVAGPFGLPVSSTLDSLAFGGLVIEPLIAPEDYEEAVEIMETLDAAQPGLSSTLSFDPWEELETRERIAAEVSNQTFPVGQEIRRLKYRLLRIFPYLTTNEAWRIALTMVAAARRAA